ncbi:response regulator [Pelotomaculum thermopropionicum SI]|uniref:Stage 0 sporulation protein A homolog n=1 Tax=Pelotomaculum thermopropionicum (strain DSM 13744 / JCM 10971 / SI) TaxID=370438 RepID=A5CYR3_PELTS|nr:response regulator [Pelotomaculum thermopropionicum SI]
MASNTILVVDDEELVQDLIRLYLEKEGFRVEVARDGEEALAKLGFANPDLVILDIMLPKMDGWAVCREIRKTMATPIIMLTAKGEEFDRVLGLELGADDYVCKPFSPIELVARIKAVLRRARGGRDSPKVLSFPGLVVDYSGHRVEVDGREVALAPKEFELLWFLASHPGQLYSREQLLKNVWAYDYLGDTRTVDTHIKRLREKLEAGSEKRYIRTVWGRGYKFEVTG